MQQKHGTRHAGQLGHQHRHNTQCAGQQACPGDALQVIEGEVPPDATSDAEQAQAKYIDAHNAEGDVVVVPGSARLVALETQPEQIGKVPAQQHRRGIGESRQHAAPPVQVRHVPIKPGPDVVMDHGRQPPVHVE